MQRSILEDVSMEELKQMRAEGLTNRQIADRLGVCSATIIRHLGPQPTGLRADYGSIAAKVTGLEPVPQRKKTLEISLRKTEYVGTAALYTLYNTGDAIIKKDGVELRFTKDSLVTLIQELIELSEEMEAGA